MERMWVLAISRVTCHAGLSGQVTLIFHLILEFLNLELLTVGWVNLCYCFVLQGGAFPMHRGSLAAPLASVH